MPQLDEVNYRVDGRYWIPYAGAGIGYDGRLVIPDRLGQVEKFLWTFCVVDVYADWSGGEA